MESARMEKKGLGRGLSALLADISPPAEPPVAAEDRPAAPTSPARTIPIDRIRPNPDQPRRSFDEKELNELAASIRERGVIQPLLLRPYPGSPQEFQIVAGERRWRAAQIANIHDLPAIVRDLNDTEVLELAIIENIQRADLNAVEEALGYRQLMDRFGHTQERLAEALGKSRSHVANLLRLLTLPEPVLDLVRSGQLSAGHARALVTAQDPEGLAKQVVARDLSVRQTEALARAATERPAAQRRAPEAKDADTRALESDLTANLRLKVTIEHKPGSSDGEVRIRYRTLEELDRLCQVLSV
ncbi:MAG TPA: ParB/RepB/Spo0J family partition protein [Amaricoccus sp.]|uniref:ParB/RepB/Spo0J family partition protein n=1 Tax=Amaricoccus sp. TaxID=1872485 RepID=UPI002CB57006|nr:ParB/RepB/Spo0J family partition protein [Amaricoccus sp.]HMQ94562.1 ParB/RepB/Spo0J family partition protein [Amaricoccus sp.]HMR50990.1 ParB/RepB/Spo0J family partition protein [Amaricoccus sp.]HMR59333.1 ParB/RepB/Spo0J family partition protein [Amaricoccus sp.]HMT97831.1 ParB/RepB/Spo0J family partition protein [Amaricoccus sp.]